MRTTLTEHGNLAVRRDHGRRVAKNPLQILLVDGVIDASAPSSLDKPENRLRRVRPRRLETTAFRHVAEPFAVERWIPCAARELHVLRIAAATGISQERDRIGQNLCARTSVLYPLERGFASALARPRRQKRRLNGRRRCGVR